MAAATVALGLGGAYFSAGALVAAMFLVAFFLIR